MYLVDSRKGGSFELSDGAVIGRDPAADLTIEDPTVSRVHAQIEVSRDGVVLSDLGSRHGTFIDGQRVESAELFAGSVVSFGRADFDVVDAVGAQTLTSGDTLRGLRLVPPVHEIWDPKKLQSDYERLRVVHEFDGLLLVEEDLDSLLERVLDMAFELMSADRGIIQLFDATGFPRTVARTRDGSTEGLRLSSTVVKSVVKARTGVIVADAWLQESLNQSDSIVSEGVRSVMCVPIFHDDEAIGVLQLDSLRDARAFDRPDLMLSHNVAARVAAAVTRITRRMRAQHQGHFTLVGRVAGGLSRDLHILLTSIRAGVGALQAAATDAATRSTADAVLSATGTAMTLVDELIAFGEEADHVQCVDDALRDWLIAFADEAPDGLDLHVELDAAASVPLTPQQILGVLKNLVHNARDALNGPGRIEVRTWRSESGTSVGLEVRDNGPGIPEDVKSRIFEPLFTTKARGAGTGLGLAVILGLVEPVGGRVDVDTAPGAGTSFRVLLPRTDSERAIAPPADAVSRPSG
ncbi:MAG: ATP-binding protein [Myxococcota bacterium]